LKVYTNSPGIYRISSDSSLRLGLFSALIRFKPPPAPQIPKISASSLQIYLDCGDQNYVPAWEALRSSTLGVLTKVLGGYLN
jgi:hypothetical protein